jgi:hypothetical protein
VRRLTELIGSLKGVDTLNGVEAAMTLNDAVLVLLGALTDSKHRAVRVPDLYLYSREVLMRQLVSDEMAAVLRSADPSTMFLLLEELRTNELVDAADNAFQLSEKGEQRLEEIGQEHPEIGADGLKRAAADLVAA